MRPFAARFPRLYHVTDRTALPAIRTHGLLSAESLCALHGAGTAPLEANRTTWTELAPGATLRWQGLPDAPLARRLAPGLTPAAWRLLVNRKVFLFAAEAHAHRLRAVEPGRDQVVLAYRTDDLAALELRACRYNNGYLDRRSLAAPRLRGPADYLPVADWGPGTPREVIVEHRIPPAITFEVLPPSRRCSNPP